jgi:hypothetical protein
MFLQIAIGAIGIGVVLMIGYIVISQVRSALPSTSTVQVENPCFDKSLSDATYCNLTSYSDSTYGTIPGGPFTDNTSQFLQITNGGYTSGTLSVQTTVFAGFGLIAVGIIVLSAFGLIQVFK